ncbi:rhomboid family intramembrane serine protease [Zavarzinia sp. CC-PAN008]|uniref:rhomboid family intramembrane serine protease n=1 Tax=Zavarzinia sp. CC-PAN008 TaxID=3243332 RepID=UPI003F7490DA
MTTRREPLLNAPGIIVALIVAILGIQALIGEVLAIDAANRLFGDFALQPARTTLLVMPGLADQVAADQGWNAADLMAVVRQEAPYGVVSLLTYALLHGGWVHAGINCAWLLAFGTVVARRLGTGRFLAFAAASAVFAGLGHLAVHPLDLSPLVGASGIVMACMGGAARFAFRRDGAHLPAIPLGQALTGGPALSFIAVLLALALLPALGIRIDGMTDGRIAWEAHIFGLAFGLLAFGWFDPPAAHQPEPDAIA